MSNDSAATLNNIQATGLAVGGVDSASTGRSICVLQAVTVSGRDGENTSVNTLQGIQAAGGAASASIPARQLITASGTAFSGAVGTSTLVIPFIAPLGSSGIIGTSAQVLQFIGAINIGLNGVIATSVLTLQLPLAAGTAGQVATGSSTAVTVPPIRAIGTAISGTGATFSAVVMHTERQALSQYQNYPFNSFARLNGVFLGAADAGLFTLAGSTDDGVNIDTVTRLGISDYGTSHLKRMERLYIGYKTDGNLVFRVYTDGSHQRDYLLTSTGRSGVHGNHVRIGRGVSSRYWQFEMRNQNGADFQLDIIEAKPTKLKRRVGGDDA
jgi:hypothetical protein